MTRSVGTLAVVLFAIMSSVGLLRYRDLVSVFDLAFWMGPSARAMASGTPCVDMTAAQLQLVDASQPTLRLCTHRRPLVPAVISAVSIISDHPAVLILIKALASSAMLAFAMVAVLGDLRAAPRWTWIVVAVAFCNPHCVAIHGCACRALIVR